MNVALTRNRDLVRSALRLQQASLMAGRAELDAWPEVSANLGTSAQHSLAPALRSAGRHGHWPQCVRAKQFRPHRNHRNVRQPELELKKIRPFCCI